MSVCDIYNQSTSHLFFVVDRSFERIRDVESVNEGYLGYFLLVLVLHQSLVAWLQMLERTTEEIIN